MVDNLLPMADNFLPVDHLLMVDNLVPVGNLLWGENLLSVGSLLTVESLPSVDHLLVVDSLQAVDHFLVVDRWNVVVADHSLAADHSWWVALVLQDDQLAGHQALRLRREIEWEWENCKPRGRSRPVHKASSTGPVGCLCHYRCWTSRPSQQSRCCGFANFRVAAEYFPELHHIAFFRLS
jgi:hypothetical protein